MAVTLLGLKLPRLVEGPDIGPTVLLFRRLTRGAAGQERVWTILLCVRQWFLVFLYRLWRTNVVPVFGDFIGERQTATCPMPAEAIRTHQDATCQQV